MAAHHYMACCDAYFSHKEQAVSEDGNNMNREEDDD